MQMRKGLLAVGLAIGLGVLGSNAHAMTLHTGPHWADSGASYHACNVTNVSSTNITDLQIVLHRADGTVAGTSGVITLGAGQTFEVVGSPAFSGFGRCRFFSPTASGSQLRANIAVFRFIAAGSFYETLSQEPAK
jgi:hypothetical protein